MAFFFSFVLLFRKDRKMALVTMTTIEEAIDALIVSFIEHSDFFHFRCLNFTCIVSPYLFGMIFFGLCCVS